MARFLFTMLPANDLGLPTRLLPIARLLADRGHEIAVFNPAPAPAKLIADAGLVNLPMPCPLPDSATEMEGVSVAWDVDHMYGAAFRNEEFIRQATALHVGLIQGFSPDVVVDSFGLFACLAAHILRVPLASVLQGNFHPASDGFVWWKGQRPSGLPSVTPMINKVAGEFGAPPVEHSVDLLAGNLSLIVGTPETDPVPSSVGAIHIGPIIWQRGQAILPDWVSRLDSEQPVIWVYSGNPRYGTAPTAVDSIVVIRAAIAALADAPVHVVLTTGYQDVPEEFGQLPSNFHHTAYLPGRAMAERSDLMVHHGGHSSVMTGLSAGTPAVVIPTITERESNARRLVAVGAGELVLPVTNNGEKTVDVEDFRDKVARVLREPKYRQAACRIAASMRTLGGVQEAADRIEQLAARKKKASGAGEA